MGYSMGRRFHDLTNKQFRYLMAIKYVRNNKHSCAMWLWRCVCGKEKVISARNVISGNTLSCGCMSKILNKRPNYSRWNGFQEISGSLIGRIKQRARNRNIEYSVLPEQLWEKYIGQNKVCALSGIPISFTRNIRNNKEMQTASLDRINSEKGYILDNIQWVHKNINFMKWNYSQEEFLYFVNLIVHPILSDNVSNISAIHIKDRSNVSGWLGFGNLSRKRYTDIARNATSRNIYFDVSIEECWRLFVEQNGRCSLTGIPIVLTTENDNTERTASLDRINSSLPYISGNVRWLHKTINQIKWTYSDDQLLQYCRHINAYQASKKPSLVR